jgi:dimethylhistidine N-methyltransferase
MKTPHFVQLHHPKEEAVRQELLQGLTTNAERHGACIAPKFLYDALGSRLFEAITELPEYYPTRTEAAILRTHQKAVAHSVPPHATLIDLGAGNCAKAASLFAAFMPRRYVAVDISVDYLRDALDRLQRCHPELDMVGVGQDFSHTLALPDVVGVADEGPRVLFYPGSSIGNFTPAQALAFLRQVHAACGPVPGSGLLIGVDLVKGAAELQAAYDDALGVTAAFNRNLLSHVNRLCGSDFALADWDHLARYNSAPSRIEMHLQARRAVQVQWPGGGRSFAQGECMHTENSYKWTVAAFSGLLREAGFGAPVVWTDATTPAQGRFAVLWAGV